MSTYGLAGNLTSGSIIPEGEVDSVEHLDENAVRVRFIRYDGEPDFIECDKDHRITIFL